MSFLTNFGQEAERIEDLYVATEYQERENGCGPAEILRLMQQKLLEEQQENQKQPKKKQHGGKPINLASNNRVQSAMTDSFEPGSKMKNYVTLTAQKILHLIELEKRERLSNIQDKEKAKRMTQQAQIMGRNSAGQLRETFNPAVKQITGNYNENCQVEIEILDDWKVQPYDIFNLTNQSRTQCLHAQFEELEQILKKDLQTEEFEDFGLPIQECMRIVGRIVNLSTEDLSLKSDQIGLFNLGSDDSSSKTYRVKLNLDEVKSYSVYEGEVVVAEGFSDANSKFNVNRLHKPQIIPATQLYGFDYLKKYAQMQQMRAMQVMVACGPFTHKNNLLYEPLQELLKKVIVERPQVLILMGPFLDAAHKQLEEGILSFKDPNTKELEFYDYTDLFKLIFKLIGDMLGSADCKTEIIVVPSAREIEMITPLPQQPFQKNLFPSNLNITLVGNPQVFRVNDISFGIVNADVVKDLCTATLTKQAEEPKIDLGLKSILQQRTFYPVYPGSPITPIEWDQYKMMMFPEGMTPDVLIVPS